MTPGAEATVRARVPVTLDRAKGKFAHLISFHGLQDGREHVACAFYPLLDVPLVRIHSECLTGDLLGSQRCDCGPQLDEALSRVSPGGLVLYLRQEGRGIGLYNKLDAYLLQDHDTDTFTANRLLGRGEDERNYAVAAQMLQALGLDTVDVLTNNAEKVDALRSHGVRVRRVVPTGVYITEHNLDYLKAKANHSGHTLAFDQLDRQSAGHAS